ncbi:MAG TPA: TonB-dependent receptor [Fulvivirga sp.]|nr:TonB-dependent receptor [Fulvivirga sp.]
MSKIFTKVLVATFFIICGFMPDAFGQTTISGKVTDVGTQDPLAGVNIIVKGKVIGTITDINGDYNLKVESAPPLTLVFSFIGFSSQEIEITNTNTTGLNVTLEEQSLLGQEIVVSASRVEENILQSPVSIEKMDILAVQNTSADNYYKGIANLKGVDVTTSSINFQIINTRGFGSTGNTRFVQLTDGMDTQAPALNFPIGNLNGPSELDVESVELIPGASSALYGPNAFNGILLVNSKNAFDYQGASAFAKLGVNHVGSDADQDMAPMYEASVRYAKAFNNKFAFKLNFSYMKADDWHGTSDFDRNANFNPFPGQPNIGADRLHYMGDEASINLAIFPFSTDWRTLANSTNSNVQFGSLNGNFYSASSYADQGSLPSQVVSVTPYLEKDLIDYGAENVKANVGLYYRLNDKIELSYLLNYGYGTSIYTGAQRYSLSNFAITQHRLQLRADNFYLRGYTTRENSGDSYITEFLALKVNDYAVKNGAYSPLLSDVSGYLATYAIEYLRYFYDQGWEPGDSRIQDPTNQLAAHNFARGVTDGFYHLDPNSPEFKAAKEAGLVGVVPKGPKFNDATNLYHVEGQYDFKNQIDAFDLQVGGNYRLFDLRSEGTIFPDKDGGIQIAEYGAYAQAAKRFLDEKLKLTGSMRYDKNENFEGQFNPRISGVFTVAQNHNFRASYQTGFRIPTTQGQFIDLNIISARLLGGLQSNYDKYQLTTNAYTIESVKDFTGVIFSGGGFASAISELRPFTDAKPVKPEQIKTIEVGYKSLIANKLLVDMAYYHNTYNDFITQIQVRKASDNVFTNPAAAASLLNGTALTYVSDGVFTGNTAQIYTNYDQKVTSQGAVLGLTYSLPRNYTIGGNYNWNKLNTEITQGFSEFNTPEHKFNLSFANRKVTDKLGFNVTYRWQDKFLWESSFATGEVPAFSTVDAQVSYKLSGLKSILKLGGSNILNKMYIQSLGGPNIGAIYYLSITFDQLMN